MKRYNVTVNGKTYDVSVEEVTAGAVINTPAPVAPTTVAPAPAAPVVPTPAPASVAAPVAPPPAPASKPPAAGSIVITSPMPGTIVGIKVSVGDAVKKNQVLLILEAMKMENEIVASQDGTVSSVNVSQGDSVNSGDTLLSIS